MPLEPDNMMPGMEPQSEPQGQVLGLHDGEQDAEGAMAKADLYKLANYSFKLFKKIQDEDQLEGWVQAKITKAADYIASVYHYLEYEMKFSEYGQKLENSEIYTAEEKAVLKNKLMEAKEKLKDLKIKQAEKEKAKDKVEEGILSGGERPCTECGGTGMVYEEPKAVPDHVKSKVDKYKRLVKATKAAHKRMDANKNGIPDDEEMEEGQEDLKKVGDTTKTHKGATVTKTSTGLKHERDPESYDDGNDESDAKSGKGTKSHAKSMSAAEKKERAPKQKQSPKSAKTWGMKDGEKFDNRDKEKEVDEDQGGSNKVSYGQGVYEGKAKKDYDGDGKVESDKDEVWGSRAKAAAKAGKPFGKDKKVSEAAKPDFLDLDKDGNKKEPMKSAAKGGDKKDSKKGMSAKQEKYFGKKEESVEPQAEVVTESADLARIKQFLTRLNG